MKSLAAVLEQPLDIDNAADRGSEKDYIGMKKVPNGVIQN